MGKTANTLVEIVYWILFFLSPFMVSIIIAIIIYLNNTNNSTYSIISLALGAGIRTIIAERIRRKHGTANFMSSLWANYESKEDETAEKK